MDHTFSESRTNIGTLNKKDKDGENDIDENNTRTKNAVSFSLSNNLLLEMCLVKNYAIIINKQSTSRFSCHYSSLEVSDTMIIKEFHIFLIALLTLYYDCSFIDLPFAM